MSFKKLVIPVSLAAMLAVGAAPALAQRGGGGHGGGGHSGGGGHFGGGGGGGHVGGGHSQGGRGGGGHSGGHHGGHQGGHPGGGGHHGGAPGHVGHGGFHGHGIGHGGHPFAHVHYRHGFNRPFFPFRSRFDLGFGLFIGYPFAYPWDYIEPYPYVNMYDPYGPAVPGDADVTGDAAVTADDDNGAAGTTTDDAEALRHYGGVSLNVTPDDASVFVDNDYAGQVKNYGPTQAPLTLAPGSHRIVISKPGYKTMTFDSDVLEGQVIPYQGTMQQADQPQ